MNTEIVFHNFIWTGWPFFLFGPLAFFLICAAIMVKTYRSSRTWMPLSGFGGILLSGFLFTARYVPSVPIRWDFVSGRSDAGNIVDRASTNGLEKKMPVLYFFHADWCTECEDYERLTLRRLDLGEKKFLLAKIDVTDMDRWGSVMKSLGVDGVPAISFQDARGVKHPEAAIEGAEISHTALRSLLFAMENKAL